MRRERRGDQRRGGGQGEQEREEVECWREERRPEYERAESTRGGRDESERRVDDGQ